MATTNELKFLMYRVAQQQGILDLSKRMVLYLLEHSDRLYTEVTITLTEGEDFTAEEVDKAARSFDKRVLNDELKKIEPDLNFYVHYGHYDEDGRFDNYGQFGETTPSSPVRYTFWLSRTAFAKSATRLSPSPAELRAIQLPS